MTSRTARVEEISAQINASLAGVKSGKPPAKTPESEAGKSWCDVALWLSAIRVPLVLKIKGTDAADVTAKAIDKMCRLSGERMRGRVERSEVRWGWMNGGLHTPPDDVIEMTPAGGES